MTTFSNDNLGPAGHNYGRMPMGEVTGTAGEGSSWRYLNPLWWAGKSVTYTLEKRVFNTFKREPAPPETKEEDVPFTQRPHRTGGDGTDCWREEQFTIRTFERSKTLVTQYYELHRINTTLSSYYQVVTGWQPVAVEAGITLPAIAGEVAGRRIAASALERGASAGAVNAGRFVTGASRALGSVGVGILVFQGTTWVVAEMSGGFEDVTSDVIGTGWELVDTEYGEWTRSESTPDRTEWRKVGDSFPCPDDDPRIEEIRTPAVDPLPREPGRFMPGPVETIGYLFSPSGPIGGPTAIQRLGLLGLGTLLVIFGFAVCRDPVVIRDVTDSPLIGLGGQEPVPRQPAYDGAAGLVEERFGLNVGLAYEIDPAGDGIYSRNGVTPGRFPTHVDISRTLGVYGQWPSSVYAGLDDGSLFGCGTAMDDYRAVCAPGASGFREVGMVVVVQELAEPIPTDSPDMLVYALVADSDGDPANNYQASPDFDWDFFQGTDHWLELVWSDGEWTLTATDASGPSLARGNVTTNARAVIAGNAIIWIVPASEYEIPSPGYRVTAFVTDGSYAPEVSGGDVSPGAPDAWSLHELVHGPPEPDDPSPGAAGDIEAIETFYRELAAAIQTGDGDFLFDHLHQASLDRYGADQCRSYTAGIQQADYQVTVDSVGDPESWTYMQDGLETSIPSAHPVELTITVGDGTSSTVAHVVLAGGRVQWFTDCGDPV